jgi:hypothetical protein
MKRVLFIGILAAISSLAMAQESNQAAQQQQNGRPWGRLPMRAHFTVDSLNNYMDCHLNLTEEQAKKVKKLNSKYAEVIEGMRPRNDDKEGQRPAQGGSLGGIRGGRPSGPPPSMGDMQGGHGGMGGPSNGMDGPGGGSMPSSGSNSDPFKEMERKQDKYDKQLRKILNDSQYAAYEKVKPKFASQRMYRDFLLFGNTPTKEGQ